MKIKKLVSCLLSTVMTVGLLSSLTVVSKAEVNTATSSSAAQQLWHAVAFGQSTDLNFSTNVLPDKIGTNYVWDLKESNKVKSTALTTEGKSAQDVLIESRGGKIAIGHDGLTYYYTELPTSKNFVLTADLTVTQFGPENGVVDSSGKQVTANGQEGAGIMVRDVNGPARQDPYVEGYSEYPAASNMLMFYYKGSNGSQISPMIYARYGVDEKCGHTENIGTVTNTAAFSGCKANIDANKSYSTQKLRLEKTDTTFIASYLDNSGNVVKQFDVKAETGDKQVTPNMLSQLDGQKYALGFFCSRNAQMKVENVQLTTSDVVNPDTTPFNVATGSETAKINVASSSYTNSDNYTLALTPTHTGTVTIKQDGNTIVTNAPVTTWQQYTLNTTIAGDSSKFDITYNANAAAAGEPTVTNAGTDITATLNVTKAAYAKDLYVSATGTGTGTKEDPMSIATAISQLVPGGTIHMLPGEYNTAVTINTNNSGTKDNRKSLVADGAVVIKGKQFQVKGDYWNISGIEVDGNKVVANPILIAGSYNTIEKCITHNGSDTGFYIKGTVNSKSNIAPSYNTVRYCESYQNWDKSAKNADGFAAKLGTGSGNRFEYCVSHDNADDGWDLFNKLGDYSTNGPTTISHCIAYNNGGNGFKLGGESLPVAHKLEYSIAYGNHLCGITDNFNPGALTIVNNTAYNNYIYNILVSKSVYDPAATISNNISFKTDMKDLHQDDYIVAAVAKNNLLFDKDVKTLSQSDFKSLDTTNVYSFNENRELVYGDCFKPVFNGIIKANQGVFNVTENLTITNADNGSATGTGTYDKGTSIDVSATPNAGYEFDSWVVVSGDVTFKDETNPTTSVTLGTENAEIKAVFRKAQTSDAGVNSAPATFRNNVVAADSAQSSAISGLQSADPSDITIFSKTAPTISPEFFANAKANKKVVTFGVLNDKNQLLYSWKFQNDAIQDMNKSIDLALSFNTDKKAAIEKLTGEINSLFLEFAYHGTLPEPVIMNVYVGDKYKNGDVVYLYYYNEDTGKIEAISESGLVVKAGYVEFTITHCSVYFLATQTPQALGIQPVSPVINTNVTDGQTTENTSTPAVGEQSTSSISNQEVSTGDMSNSMLFIIIMCGAMGVFAYTYKKKKLAQTK